MKKLKNYILMLLVPLILLGCVSKGVSEAVEDTTDSNLGGYTWAQLQAMVNGTANSNASVSTNRTGLNYLRTEAANDGKTSAVTKIDTLSNYLYNNVYISIISSDENFVYATSLSKVKEYNEDITELLSLYSYEKLVAIREQMDKLITNYPSDNTLQAYYSFLDSSISTIEKYTSVNPFYANVWDLYKEYSGNIGTTVVKNYLAAVPYNLDVDAVDQSSNITVSKSVLVTEISQLNSNTQPFSEKDSLLEIMEELNSTYQKYLDGTVNYTNVQSIRTLLRNTESTILTSGSTLPNYVTMVQDIYDKLLVLDTSSSSTKADIADNLTKHIYNNYILKNLYYTNENYLFVNSKVVTLVKELEYLKSQDTNIRYIGITPKW